jgi:succinyl-CoA synthetase beta subunit
VHIVDTIEEVQEVAARMCGKLMSFPSEERGLLCNSILVYERIEIEKEFFLSIDYDRQAQQPIITYSERGGMTLP